MQHANVSQAFMVPKSLFDLFSFLNLTSEKNIKKLNSAPISGVQQI